jgi:hypothetical protein
LATPKNAKDSTDFASSTVRVTGTVFLGPQVDWQEFRRVRLLQRRRCFFFFLFRRAASAAAPLPLVRTTAAGFAGASCVFLGLGNSFRSARPHKLDAMK